MYIIPDSELVKEAYNERVAEARRSFGGRNVEAKKGEPLRARLARILRRARD